MLILLIIRSLTLSLSLSLSVYILLHHGFSFTTDSSGHSLKTKDNTPDATHIYISYIHTYKANTQYSIIVYIVVTNYVIRNAFS